MTATPPTIGDGHLLTTPAGALRAMTPTPGPIRDALRALLRSETTVPYSAVGLRSAMPTIELWQAARLVDDLCRGDLVVVSDRAYRLGEKKVEVVLPTLLERLSGRGRGLLADNEGFLVSSVGYSEELSINMAALAVEVVDFDRRWRERLAPGEVVPLPAWWTNWPGAEDRLGVFTLAVGEVPFVLVVEGEFRLRDAAFVWLVWSLSHRYDRRGSDTPTEPAAPTPPRDRSR